jgi:D-sedoheptulose 7-phosphate isomerase
MKEFFNNYNKSILQSIKILKKISIIKYKKDIFKICNLISNSIKNGGIIYICGNGGSAAEAQHLSAEFLVRLKSNLNRRPLPLISLSFDISNITACSNDYAFSEIFSRNLEAVGKKNDILIVMSTSGNSKNIIKVLKKSKQMGIKSVGFLGNKGGKAKKYTDLKIIVPIKNVARIQEIHLLLGHILLEEVEKKVIYNK